MKNTIYEKKTWETDEGTITTDKTFVGKQESIKEAIRRGNLRMPNTKEARLKLFSEAELKEMGYDTEEKEDI